MEGYFYNLLSIKVLTKNVPGVPSYFFMKSTVFHVRTEDLQVDLHRDPLCSEHTQKQRWKGVFGYGKILVKSYMPSCSLKKKIINNSKDVNNTVITELEKIELTTKN